MTGFDEIVTWRYSLPALKGGADSWSIVFVDSTGCFSVLSDYGDYAYRWQTRHTGCDDFRDFLVRLDADYLGRKIGRREDTNQFDGEATRKRIREHILQKRRQMALTRDAARHEWNLLPEFDDLTEFHDWYQHTSFSDAYEFKVHRWSHHLTHWTTVSFERLKRVIREQLAAERAPTASTG